MPPCRRRRAVTGGTAARWVDEALADVITERAVAFVEQHRAKPFFLSAALVSQIDLLASLAALTGVELAARLQKLRAVGRSRPGRTKDRP